MLTLVDVLDSSNWSGVFNKVIFVDVETGEQYPIEIANFVNAYWQDSSTIIFVHGIYCAQAKYISVLDLRTGKLARNKVDGSGYDFCPPLMPKFDVGVSLWDLEPSPVYIYNTRQETYENFWGQTDGWLNASAELSSDNRTLVVLQYKPQSNVDGRFLVYDFLTREVKGTYEVKNTRRYFLISDDNASVVFLEGNTPCVLNLENLSRKCGIPLSDEYKGIFPVGLSRDNSKLFFLHRVEEGSAFVGGLCIKEIYSYSSKAICPMSKLNYLRSISWDEFYVSSYKFSPDEKYIIFNYGGGCPQCDFNGVEGTAIVDLDGNLLFNLKINTDFEWRPTQ